MQASNQKPRLPFWVRIAIIVFAVLLIVLAYGSGSVWLGHFALLLLALAATWLLDPNWRPLARLLIVLVFLTAVLTTVFVQVPSALAQTDPLQPPSPDESPVAVLILGALALSLFLVGATLLVAMFVSIEWILNMPEVRGVGRLEALRLISSMLLHTNYAYYVVENGEITESKPKGMLPFLGGPGKVVIKPYNAVVFERSGDVTRIEGPGLILTRRFEFAKAIFDLRKQWITWTTDELLTRDHVPLRFKCGVGFRIESARETARRIRGQTPDHLGGQFPNLISGDYKVYQHTLYRAAYETTKAGWQTTTQATTETQLLNIVRKYPLEAFYQLEEGRLIQEESIMAKIVQETMQRTNKITHTWGVIITAFKITNFEAPRDIREKLNEMWAAEYARERQRIAAVGEARALISRSAAEVRALGAFERLYSRARETFIEQIQDGLDHGLIVSDAVADRFIAAIQRISQNLIIDRLSAARYVEMLERIAESEGTKTLIIGEDRGLRRLGENRGDDSE